MQERLLLNKLYSPPQLVCRISSDQKIGTFAVQAGQKYYKSMRKGEGERETHQLKDFLNCSIVDSRGSILRKMERKREREEGEKGERGEREREKCLHKRCNRALPTKSFTNINN